MLGKIRRAMGWLSLSLLLGLCLAPQVWAVNVTVGGRYKGEANGQFKTVSPWGYFCRYFFPRCLADYPVDVPVTFTKSVASRADDIRQRLYVKMPDARTIDVVNEHGERYQVTVAFRHVSLESTLREGTRHPAHTVRGGCTLAASRKPGMVHTATFVWKAEDTSLPCYNEDSETPGDTSLVDFENFGVAVFLTTPPPRDMSNGMYRGSLSYSIGEGGDFDFGDAVTNLSSRTATFHIELEVLHDLFLRFPANSERALLEPPGGWQNWLVGRRPPTRLYRDMPFRVWSTGQLRVYKLCQYDQGTVCAIRDGGGHQVPLNVALTLPGGMAVGGRPVEREPIPTGEGAALVISNHDVVWNRAAALHFDVDETHLPSMLLRPGNRYEGLVTVLFDAEA